MSAKLVNLRFKGNSKILKIKFSTCSSYKASKVEDLNVLNKATTLNCFKSKGDTDVVGVRRKIINRYPAL